MKRLLVTGATGLLGAHIVRSAAAQYEAIGAARAQRNVRSGSATYYFDLAELPRLRRALDECRPEVIVHCGAMTDVDRCEIEPELARAVNTDASRTLAKWARQHAAKMVFVSSDSVFRGESGRYDETQKPEPVNVYARSKLDAERAIEACCTNVLVVRTNFYGLQGIVGTQTKTSLSEWMLGKFSRGEEVPAFSDVIFSPLFAKDLAGIILDLLARGAEGIFHVAASDCCSKYEFAKKLARVFGFPEEKIRPASIESFRLRARRPANTSLCVEKCERFLEKAMPSIEEGLIHYREFLRLADFSSEIQNSRLTRTHVALAPG